MAIQLLLLLFQDLLAMLVKRNSTKVIKTPSNLSQVWTVGLVGSLDSPKAITHIRTFWSTEQLELEVGQFVFWHSFDVVLVVVWQYPLDVIIRVSWFLIDTHADPVIKCGRVVETVIIKATASEAFTDSY